MLLKIRYSLACLALVAGLVGCSATGLTSSSVGSAATSQSTTTSTTSTGSASTSSEQLNAMLSANQASHYSTEDSAYDESSVVDITLSGSSATASDSGVNVSGSTVTVTAAGTYRLSGSLAGQIVVNAGGADVKLILNGVELTNTTASPVVITTADEVTIILADGSANTVTDTSTYADSSEDAPSSAIDSASDLSIAGTGSLTVTGNHNDAINSADGLVIAGGTITVKAVDDGIRGKDYVIISDGTVTIEATGDGIKSDNETDTDRGYVHISGGQLSVSSGDDGIKGFNDLAISGGTVTVSKSVEALEAQALVITGGETNLTSSDDGVNISGDAADAFNITGGKITINAEGDGLDSNSSGTISGGTVVVYGPTNDGNGSVDVQNGLIVTGGDLWALGSSGMAESPAEGSTQAFVFTNLNGNTTGEVQILDSEGNLVASQSSDKQYSSVLYSGSAVIADGVYQISVDENVIGSVTANQYVQGMGGAPGGGRR